MSPLLRGSSCSPCPRLGPLRDQATVDSPPTEGVLGVQLRLQALLDGEDDSSGSGREGAGSGFDPGAEPLLKELSLVKAVLAHCDLERHLPLSRAGYWTRIERGIISSSVAIRHKAIPACRRSRDPRRAIFAKGNCNEKKRIEYEQGSP